MMEKTVDILGAVKMKTHTLALTTILAFTTLPTIEAHASMIGDYVDFAYVVNGTTNESRSVDNILVDEGVEYDQSTDGLDTASFRIDISENSIDIFFDSFNYYTNTTFIGPVISSLNDDSGYALSGFTNFSALLSDGRTTDFTEDLIDFGDDWMSFNFEGIGIGPATVHVDLVFQPVPVPAAVWLFGSGLISLIGFARRKKA